MKHAHWTFVTGALLVAWLVPPALEAMGSKTAFVHPVIWALLALAFFAERFGAMHMQVYSLTNHIVWHIANGTTGLIMIALAFVLYPFVGVISFPTAMLVAYAAFYVVYSTRRSMTMMQVRFRAFEAQTSALPGVVLCAGLGTQFLMMAVH